MFMYYILYSYNKLQINVIMKTIKNGKYMYNTVLCLFILLSLQYCTVH